MDYDWFLMEPQAYFREAGDRVQCQDKLDSTRGHKLWEAIVNCRHHFWSPEAFSRYGLDMMDMMIRLLRCIRSFWKNASNLKRYSVGYTMEMLCMSHFNSLNGNQTKSMEMYKIVREIVIIVLDYEDSIQKLVLRTVARLSPPRSRMRPLFIQT
jgi:hypothetical protein